MQLHAKDKDDFAKETEVNPRVYNEADEKKMRRPSKTRMLVPDYKSYLSEFDDYVVASEKFGCKVSKYGFEMGDMVWGKVKSHPWWPGYILNEAFGSPSVRRMKKIGYVLVAFFGDCSYGWFDPSDVIPFEPYLEEKSKQTSASNFVKAVEEAMEEVGKRFALGLTCKCRNPLNFRPSNVQGYFVVDVVGYELQAVYSSKQIKKARDGFSCVETLSFVKRCALAPGKCDTESLKFCQRKAAVYAFRRAVFEEFDEPYKQAFGATSGYSLVKTEEVINRMPPRALLSGSFVTGEALDDTKSSIMKEKDSTKTEKYLPRRREEAGDMTVHFGQVQASSQLQDINGALAEDHLLQRKTPYLQSPMKHEQTGLVSMEFTPPSGDISGNESYVSKLSPDDDKGLPQESKVGIEGKAALISENEKFEAMTILKQEDIGTHSGVNKGSRQPFIDSKCSAGVGLKKVNVLKRSSEKLDSETSPKKKKKKEPGSELNRESSDKRKPSLQLGSGERHLNLSKARNSNLDVLQLLNNLQVLSLGPFFGSLNKSSIRAVRQFFLRFRSFVNHKSLASSPPPTKSARTLSSTNKPSKAGEKRLSPYPQQETPSTKKLKKTSQFRPMSSYKKTNKEEKKISKRAPFNPVRDQGGQVPINTKPVKAQPGKKIAPSVKVIEPTMLIMKFPSGTSLPSVPQLKARLSRFGLLDKSATRVFWKSSSCRVVFLYKLDAQTALRYVSSGSNSLFGNVNVAYSLIDVKASSASRDHEKKKARTDEPVLEPLSQRLGGTPPIDQPKIQLKSCLKKPLNSSNGKRRTTRVKFRLDISQYSRTKHGNNQVDISEQMMKLLLRCNDVVGNVKSMLGYVPYHCL